ncbi:MAG: OprO/OprP family phosphate-selective porin [Lysobacterales bacterium]
MSRSALLRRAVSLALIAAFAAPAHAEIMIDAIADSEVSIEGLFQADGNWFNNDKADLSGFGANGKDSEFAIRRAEMILKGKGPGNFEWVLGYDASTQKSVVINTGVTPSSTATVNSSGKWLDANVKYKIGGDANHYVQVGQYKQPNSLEELSSTRHNDFISKAMVTNTFGVARRLGVAYHYGSPDWGVTASYFGRELTRNLAHGNGFGVRGNWAPINGTANILHFGASYVDYDTDGDVVRLRTRPNADLALVRLVDTGATGIRNADRLSTIGGEAMWIKGPVKLQAEYMRTAVDRYDTGFASQPGRSYDSDSGYVSALWNVTGETWGYKDGVPTTSLPNEPGSGMWQVGLRYDRIDLDDGSFRPGATPSASPIVDGVLGGEMSAVTAGVSWYWRSNFKFSFNYVKVDSSRFTGRTSSTFSSDPAFNGLLVNGILDDSPDILEARLQFYF